MTQEHKKCENQLSPPWGKMATPSKKSSKEHVSSRRLVIVVSLLCLFAAAATATRYKLEAPGQFPAGDSTWAATLLATVSTPEVGALIRIAPPWDTTHTRLYGQSQYHPGMRPRRTKTDKRARDIILVATRAGEFTINMRFDLHVSQIPRNEPKRPLLKENDRGIWLSESPGIPAESPGAIAILETMTQDMPETPVLVGRLFEHVSEKIRIVPKGSDDGAIAMANRKASALGMTRTLVTLLRAAHLPARIVTGLDLSLSQDRQPRYWAETYYDDRWQALDVAGGHFNELPVSYVPLRKGNEQLIETENAQVKSVRWNIQQAEPPRGLLASDKPNLMSFLDLTRLAPATREVLALLLLLPLGALSTEILRHLVGIRTYGTFTPTLLALAAVFADWLTAATVFGLVTVLGVAGRSLMPELNLARVPRLSIVFTLVAMIMTLVVSLLIYFNPTLDSAVVLLPTVILTMLVDRIYTVADETGLRIALFRLGWTMLAALFSLVILLQSEWGAWLLAYPEMHAITVALIILLGRYQGQRLSDLYGLNWLREPAKPSVKIDSDGTGHKSEQTDSIV